MQGSIYADILCMALAACVVVVLASWFAMVSALNSKSYPLRDSHLLGESIVEVHYRIGSDPGYAFFFEERAAVWFLSSKIKQCGFNL